MTDSASASDKAKTGHSCCGGGKAQEQALKKVAVEVKSAGRCGGEKVQAQSATVAVDPVCGMTVSPTTAKKISFQGRDVFFCSSVCHAKFDASPATFLGKAHKPMESHHG